MDSISKLQGVLKKQESWRTSSKNIKLFIIAITFSIYLNQGVLETVPSPFFPLEAARKNTNESWVGIISSSFDFAVLVATLLLTPIAKPQNLKYIFSSGQYGSAICLVLFGVMKMAPPDNFYKLFCLATRTVGGLCTGGVWLVGIPLVVPLFPDSVGKVSSIVVFGYSFGLIIGPIFGSILYGIGGYVFPFVVVGIIEICLAIITTITFPTYDEMRDYQVRNGTIVKDKPNKSSTFGFVNLMLHPSVLLSLTPMLTTTCLRGFFEVSLSVFFAEKFGVKEADMGYYFIFLAVSFSVASIGSGLLVDKGFGGKLAIGSVLFLLISIWAFLLPTQVSYFEEIWFFGIFLTVLGAASGCAGVVSFLIIEKASRRTGCDDLANIKIYAVALNTVGCEIGRVSGQMIFGGILKQFTSYYTSIFVQALIFIFLGIIFTIYMIKTGMMRQIYFDKFAEKQQSVSSYDVENERVHLLSKEFTSDQISVKEAVLRSLLIHQAPWNLSIKLLEE